MPRCSSVRQTGSQPVRAERQQQLLRTHVLDALHRLLEANEWSKITLGDVAKSVGISRQTLYNEFGNRTGLAQAYAVRLAEGFVDHVEVAIESHQGDLELGLTHAVQGFFLDAAANPMVRSLLLGEKNGELLRLVTVNSEPILVNASERLDGVLRDSWVNPPAVESKQFARMAVRMAMSYIAMPPEPDADPAADFAAILTPFIHSLLDKPQD